MERNIRVLAVWAVWACLGAAGLGGCEEEGGTIPAALEAIESGAEDAYDQALASDFQAVRASAQQLRSGWEGFRAQATADGATAETVAALDTAVEQFASSAGSAEDPVALARAANAVSEHMDQLYALYDPPTPPELLSLDYLGREVALDALGGAFDQAGQDLDALDARWTALKPRIEGSGGGAAAAEYDRLLAEARQAVSGSDADALGRAANAGLEEVDVMENLFASADAPD